MSFDLYEAATLEQLKPLVSPSDYRKAVLVVNDARRAMAALNEESSSANRKNFTEAEAVLSSFVGGLVEAHLEGSKRGAKAATGEVFANKLKCWEFLQGAGWQVSRALFYRHCRENKLPREKNGKYTRANVEAYAATYCRRVDTGLKVGEEKGTVADQREAVRLEREKVRLQKERRELELIEGKSIPRAEVELMIVGRAVSFLSHLRAMVQMHASDLIHIVGGDQSRATEMIAELQGLIEEHVSTFARDVEFKVMLAPAGVDQSQPDDLDDSDE